MFMKSNATTDRLELTAKALLAPGKGILAADESNPTIEKRFKAINLPSTEANRRAYRELLFTTPGLSEFISGVILFDETIPQKSKDGIPFPQLLWERGIIPGIKVDAGTVALAHFPDEKMTQGLDGLRERLADYAGLGVRFAKWRAVIRIGKNIPTRFCLEANAHALARYAALAQEAGLLPIVEPEVLRDGDHPIERCYEVTALLLQKVFAALFDQRVRCEAMLLKPNMITPGKDCAEPASVEEVAATTVRCLRQTVPAAVPGIVFLSGGQTEPEATAHLNVMNQIGGTPWALSFSYGRALQAAALKAWNGDPANSEAGQRALYRRAQCNSAARFGKYSPHMEDDRKTPPLKNPASDQ